MIEIRRNTRLATAIAAAATLVALAFLIRGGTVSVLVGLVLLALAAGAAWAWFDGRTPLMVLDEQGVRLRLGADWRGMPWRDIDEIEHMPRPSGWAGLWRDGRLAILPTDEPAQVLALTDRSARHAAWTQRFFGVPFAVPLGLGTLVSGASKPLTAALADMAGSTTRVVEIDPEVESVPVVEDTGAYVGVTAPAPVEPLEPAESVGPVSAAAPVDESVVVADEPVVSAETSLVSDETSTTTHETSVVEVEPPVAVAAVSPLRDLQRPVRVEAVYAPVTDGANALAVEHEPVTLIEIVEPEVEVAPDVVPVIGPRITKAREQYRLSIEELAERTRIRPHVLEAIESDDFAACGGDFYARGHLRTLARVLGLDAADLMASYDEHYGSAPVDPREVFAAELGGDKQMRPVTGGPNWSVMVASGMAVVLLWSLVRLFTAGAAPQAAPGISLEGSISNPYATLSQPVAVKLQAVGAGTHVVVRDASGAVVFSGDLTFGGTKKLQASPPVRVQSSDGSLTVSVAGGSPLALGTLGQPAQRTFTSN